METMRTFGPALSPFNAWMLLQGLETLPLRMDRHCANALAVAHFLQDHPQVSWVNYPGLPGNRYHALAKKYLPQGRERPADLRHQGRRARPARRSSRRRTFMSHLANVGDAKTLVIHPASTTHRQMSEEEQVEAGVGARHGPHVGRARDARRHPVGHRSGAARGGEGISQRVAHSLGSTRGYVPLSPHHSTTLQRQTRHEPPQTPPPRYPTLRRPHVRAQRRRHLAAARRAGGPAHAARRRQRRRRRARHRDHADRRGADLQRHRQRRVRHPLGRQEAARPQRLRALAGRVDAGALQRRQACRRAAGTR